MASVSVQASWLTFPPNQIKKPAAGVKTTPNHEPTTSETARKAWPPDPDTCSEFTPISLQDLERDFAMNMSFSPQLAAMESQNLQLQEEIAKLGAKISAFEKEKADLAKKLEDARIHSKRQNEVKLSSGFYSYSF